MLLLYNLYNNDLKKMFSWQDGKKLPVTIKLMHETNKTDFDHLV